MLGTTRIVGFAQLALKSFKCGQSVRRVKVAEVKRFRGLAGLERLDPFAKFAAHLHDVHPGGFLGGRLGGGLKQAQIDPALFFVFVPANPDCRQVAPANHQSLNHGEVGLAEAVGVGEGGQGQNGIKLLNGGLAEFR